MDRNVAESAIITLLEQFNIKPETHSDIKNTPRRVIKMLEELWEGEKYTNEEIAMMYAKTFPLVGEPQVVSIKNINAFSMCEHHMALMYDMTVNVTYIPKDKVIGLSKIPRIAQMCCKRLQLQERIGQDILEVIKIATGAEDILVEVEAKHSCVTARGIKEKDSVTYTAVGIGKYR